MTIGSEKVEGFQKGVLIGSEKSKKEKLTRSEKVEGSCIASVVVWLNSLLFSILCGCSPLTLLPAKGDGSPFWIVWTVAIELRPCSLFACMSKTCKLEKQ